jgi:predicted RNA-binding protein with PIN domain
MPEPVQHRTADAGLRNIEYEDFRPELTRNLVVDGYNVCRGAGPVMGRDLQPEELVRELARYRKRYGGRVIVIFDASGSLRGISLRQGGGEVRYSKSLKRSDRADDDIKQLVKTLTGTVIVVTSDGRLRESLRSRGVRSVRSNWFLARHLLPKKGSD